MMPAATASLLVATATTSLMVATAFVNLMVTTAVAYSPTYLSTKAVLMCTFVKTKYFTPSQNIPNAMPFLKLSLFPL